MGCSFDADTQVHRHLSVICGASISSYILQTEEESNLDMTSDLVEAVDSMGF